LEKSRCEAGLFHLYKVRKRYWIYSYRFCLHPIHAPLLFFPDFFPNDCFYSRMPFLIPYFLRISCAVAVSFLDFFLVESAMKVKKAGEKRENMSKNRYLLYFRPKITLIRPCN